MLLHFLDVVLSSKFHNSAASSAFAKYTQALESCIPFNLITTSESIALINSITTFETITLVNAFAMAGARRAVQESTDEFELHISSTTFKCCCPLRHELEIGITCSTLKASYIIVLY